MGWELASPPARLDLARSSQTLPAREVNLRGFVRDERHSIERLSLQWDEEEE